MVNPSPPPLHFRWLLSLGRLIANLQRLLTVFKGPPLSPEMYKLSGIWFNTDSNRDQFSSSCGGKSEPSGMRAQRWRSGARGRRRVCATAAAHTALNIRTARVWYCYNGIIFEEQEQWKYWKNKRFERRFDHKKGNFYKILYCFFIIFMQNNIFYFLINFIFKI